ncbi:MAG: metal ABC transporter permease [Pseudomonadota bacterium]
MIAELIEPFSYNYMVNAMFVSALVGGVCAALSAFLMLKGWSLIGDALSHSVVPGVAGAYILGFPFAAGAFLAGGLAAGSILFLTKRTGLKEDVIIGLIFTSFFGLGLFLVSIFPTSISIQTIIMGNILAIRPADTLQLVIIGGVTVTVLLFVWRDLLAVFFDENHAHSIGLRPGILKAIFFTLLSASVVAAMQTVGAFLVIALVITPGATAYLLTDRFDRLIQYSVVIGAGTSFTGAYFSFFLNGATGGLIVCLQTLLFILAFIFAPKHGRIASMQQIAKADKRIRDNIAVRKVPL